MEKLMYENSLSSEERLEMEAENDPTIRDYSINNYNGLPGLAHWGYQNPYDPQNLNRLHK